MGYSHHPFKNKKCLPKLPKAGLGKQGNLIEYMKLLPRYIIFWAITNYMDEVKQEEIMKEFVTYKKIGDALFMRVINKHFDIEVFRKNLSSGRIYGCTTIFPMILRKANFLKTI